MVPKDKLLEAVLEKMLLVTQASNLYNVELFFNSVCVYVTWQLEDGENLYRLMAAKREDDPVTYDFTVQGIINMTYKIETPEQLALIPAVVRDRTNVIINKVKELL